MKEPYREASKQINTYDRERLYTEVWEKAVIYVADDYGVSTRTISEVCRKLCVPVPPRGYWAKKNAGKKVMQIPLPKAHGVTTMTGARSYVGTKQEDISVMLDFLNEAERQRVLEVAERLRKPCRAKARHAVLCKWKKRNKPEQEMRFLSTPNKSCPECLSAERLSTEQLPRALRILNTVFYAIEELGGFVNEDLTLEIRGECVSYQLFETRRQIKRIPTDSELAALSAFKAYQRDFNKWAPKPLLTEYDYEYRGILQWNILKSRLHRDSTKKTLEVQLGDILIDLYLKSELVKTERIADLEKRNQIPKHPEQFTKKSAGFGRQ